MTRKLNKVNTPGGVLTRLKNKICLELGINHSKLKILIQRHTMRSFNGVKNVKMQFDKMNTFTELSKEDITIKVFFKFLRLLDPETVKITVEVKTKRGDVINVSETMKYFSNDVLDD